MLQIRRADERGQSKLSWLDSRFSFSFAEYYDPAHMGFRTLRVINDDHIAPAGGFGTHGHRDMEILTYVLEGQLEHKDSLGNGSIIQPGEIQRMSAGRGIQHSEFNHSRTQPVHLLQIWILPNQPGLPPSYEQKTIDLIDGEMHLIAAPEGEGTVTIHQDARVFAARPRAGQRLSHPLTGGRFAWLQVARGSLDVDGQPLTQGDGASFAGPTGISITASSDAEFLLFDLS